MQNDTCNTTVSELNVERATVGGVTVIDKHTSAYTQAICLAGTTWVSNNRSVAMRPVFSHYIAGEQNRVQITLIQTKGLVTDLICGVPGVTPSPSSSSSPSVGVAA